MLRLFTALGILTCLWATQGPQALYDRLYGQTLNTAGTMYGGGGATYTVRPYVDANQQAGGTYFLGIFNTYVATNGVYDYMFFSGGSSAGCPRQRDLKMYVVCGDSFVTNSVAEPSICAYTLNVSLPEACGVSFAVGDEAASALPMPSKSPSQFPTPSITSSRTPTPSLTPSASPYPPYKWVHWVTATTGVRGAATGYVDLSTGERITVSYAGEVQTAALHGATSDPFSGAGWFLPPRAIGFYLNPFEGWSMYGGGTKAAVQFSKPVRSIAVGMISVGQPSVQQTIQFNTAVQRGPVNYNFGAYGLSFPAAYTVTGNEGNGVVINNASAPDASLLGIDALLWTHVGYEVYTVITVGIIDLPLPYTDANIHATASCSAGVLGGACLTGGGLTVMIEPLLGASGILTYANMTGAGSTGIGPADHAYPRARFFSFEVFAGQPATSVSLSTCETATTIDTYIQVLREAPRGLLSAAQTSLLAFNDDQGENTPWGGTVACAVGPSNAAKKSLVTLPSPSPGLYYVVISLRGISDGAMAIRWTMVLPSPTGTPTGTPSVSITASITPSMTGTPTGSPSLSPSSSISATASLSATGTPSISATSSVSSTTSRSPTSSLSPSSTITTSLSITATSSISSTTSRSPTSSLSPSSSITASPSVSQTTTESVTPSVTPTSSLSPSSSMTASSSVSVTASVSATNTETPTSSTSPSWTITPSTSQSPSSSVSSTASVSPSASSSISPTASLSPSSSISPTASPSALIPVAAALRNESEETSAASRAGIIVGSVLGSVGLVGSVIVGILYGPAIMAYLTSTACCASCCAACCFCRRRRRRHSTYICPTCDRMFDHKEKKAYQEHIQECFSPIIEKN